MHAEHGLHRELLEQAVGHHFSRAAAAFFGGLKDQVNGAVKVAVLRQVLRGGQQHGDVAVVAASVHLAGVAAGVGEVVELLHRQRVHVGAQTDGAFAGALLDDADHARAPQPAMHRNAPLRQLLRHQVGGAVFFKAQFGVRVHVPAQSSDARCMGFDGGNGLHEGSLANLDASVCTVAVVGSLNHFAWVH